MNIAIFVIFVSVFAVTVLAVFAFFPIRVSWFYHSSSAKRIKHPAPKGAPLSLRGEYLRARDEDNFDDPEL